MKHRASADEKVNIFAIYIDNESNRINRHLSYANFLFCKKGRCVNKNSCS